MSHYLIPDWPALDCVKAYTTLRFNGHSKAPFDQFNLSTKEGDDATSVQANRLLLCQELGLKNEPMWLNQIHSTIVVQADEIRKKTTPDADAAHTGVPEVVCAVLTADCLPLLLCHEQGTHVAAVHAGWRGLLNGVIESTVAALKPPCEFWMAWLGPAIGPASFEVSDEIRDQFIEVDAQAALAFEPIGPNAWFGDLYTIARQRLAKLGIKRVYGGDFDTYADKQRFYSYRRDQGKTGRMASLIWINH